MLSFRQNKPIGHRHAKKDVGFEIEFFEGVAQRDPNYIEALQILGDAYGSIVHLFERDCTVQRRHQKVVERAPAPYLNEEKRSELCAYALKIAHAARYQGAGTVESLGQVHRIRVRPGCEDCRDVLRQQ